METGYSTHACPVCEAPLRSGEYNPHIKGCIKLTLASMSSLQPKPSPSELAIECKRIHDEDQASTHLRLNIPPQHEPRQPHGWGWGSRGGGGQTFPVPEGKKLCAHCNGITHMYPNCGNCDGKGWVD